MGKAKIRQARRRILHRAKCTLYTFDCKTLLTYLIFLACCVYLVQYLQNKNTWPYCLVKPLEYPVNMDEMLLKSNKCCPIIFVFFFLVFIILCMLGSNYSVPNTSQQQCTNAGRMSVRKPCSFVHDGEHVASNHHAFTKEVFFQ